MNVQMILDRISRPSKAVVTAGMPYANGPLHLGHLAGAQLPADIHTRWLSLLIGRENVLFVCGTDDHGSTSELMAMKAGRPVADVIDEIHQKQANTLKQYGIDLDIYSGTSRPETFDRHAKRCQEILEKLHTNGVLNKRTSKHWYDPEVDRFLPDRLVTGTCPQCHNERAYSDECDACSAKYDASDLLEPKSAVSQSTPELRNSAHLWLDMWEPSELIYKWVASKGKNWRSIVSKTILEEIAPALRFNRDHEEFYKTIKKELPKHKPKYAKQNMMLLQFTSKIDLLVAQTFLSSKDIDSHIANEWAYRSISRDIPWGIPVPAFDNELKNKTLYVWPDSLLAPIAFSEAALEARGESTEQIKEYWYDANAKVYQFLGQDNVFFYVLMQAAMWIGSQEDQSRLPVDGELQLNEVFGCFHLSVNGAKMSKSTGNFYTGEQLVNELGYDADQIRYFLALQGLGDKPSDFDFKMLNDRNAFLAGRMNAAFERPISATHSKFSGVVPEGKLIEKVEKDTFHMVQRYTKAMGKANYPNMLYELENYARKINTLFNKHKPHDDRFPEEQRKDALFSAYYLLKNLMIMLYPFVPQTMERLREALNLPAGVFTIDQLGTGIEAGHKIGQQGSYFPNVDTVEGNEAQ
jgi:methionyl-tRNA synthetase